MCVTVNEGYLKAANRSSDNIQFRNQNITSQPSLDFFVVFFAFRDCRSTKLLRLFSGNLPAMF